MPITPLPTPPLRSDGPTSFADRGDTFMAALPAFVTQANALEANVELIGSSAQANSESSYSSAVRAEAAADIAGGIIGTTVWVSGATYAVGDTRFSNIDFQIYRRKIEGGGSTDPKLDSVNWVRAINGLPSQTGNSGKVLSTNGSNESWQDIPVQYVGDHSVIVNTGNGHGSTNTKIRRFTTTLGSVGTAITYAGSATLGDSFTINESGLYAITYSDSDAAGCYIGLSLNSTALSDDIYYFLNDAFCLARAGFPVVGANAIGCVSVVTRISAGGVVRPHNGTATPTGTTGLSSFTIRKVGV